MNDIFSCVPLPEGKFDFEYDCGDGAYMLCFRETDADKFLACCEKIKDAGFTLYDSADIEGNMHRTFIGNLALHIYYSLFENTIRIIADRKIPSYNRKPVICGKMPSVLWQFEVDHSLIDCGMCYIVRCDDGSFFIIDSPHFYSVNDDIRIIGFLKKISGEAKPRVAGWFFSHGHEDHLAKFNDILKYHDKELTIEKVFCNIPSPEHRDADLWGASSHAMMRNFREVLEAHPDIQVVKLHSGMHFCVRNLEFDVLCTHEDTYPESTEDFNNTSTAIKMTVDGCTVMFPGDSSAHSNKILTGRYNEALKSDIVQISHHGHFGLSPKFYRRVNAQCTLFPVTVIKYEEEWPRQEANRVAFEIAKESYIASNGTVEIPLPYVFGQTKVLPDETFEDFDGIFNLWSYEYTDEYKEKLYNEFLKRSGKGE